MSRRSLNGQVAVVTGAARGVGEVLARKLAAQLKLPLFDAAVQGYPQRMRDYEEVRIKRERRERAERLRDRLREPEGG